MTPAGIERATFRFVAQHLNHCVTAVPAASVDRIILENLSVSVWTNLTESVCRTVPGSCYNSKKISRLIRDLQFIDQLSDYQLLKKD